MNNIAKIVIINGCGGVGKDTFCELCSQIVPCENYSSVKEIKEIARIMGWDGGKTEKDRKFLSDLKMLASEFSDFPYKCIKNKIDKFLMGDNAILFIHIRDIAEIERLKAEMPAFITTLLIRNSRVKPITSNIADANVENFNYDYIINNEGSLEELKQAAVDFVYFLQKGQY